MGSEVLVIPKETSGYVFFSFATGSRTAQWERGYDPMVQFSFTTNYDEYGQPGLQLSAALPRGIMPPYIIGQGTSPAEEGNKILSTASVTKYARTNIDDTTVFIVDRTCKATSYEIIQQDWEDVFILKNRVFNATLPGNVDDIVFPVIGFSVSYYDAPDAFGDGLLPLGTLGKHGAAARSETLVLTDKNIEDAYGAGNTPIFFQPTTPTLTDFTTAGYPADFYNSLQNGDVRLGYKRHDMSTEPEYMDGWYAESGRTKYDWQDLSISNPTGLVLATKDVFNSWNAIEYDDYNMMPEKAKQYLTLHPTAGDALETKAEYDYRVMQASLITDPNGNRAIFSFSPLGLLLQSGVIGKDTINLPYPTYVAEGDLKSENIVGGKRVIDYEPSVKMEYDFFAFLSDGNPVWVKTIQRETHWQPDHDPDAPTIIKVEYTDGFGRLLQTRSQAEDVIFGDQTFGDSGLPEDQSAPNQPAIGIERLPGDPLNVVVSGWRIYNNKGKVVEQYEPFFDKGFDYSPPFNGALSGLTGATGGLGERIRMFYDTRGTVIRTLNPDGTQQWVIHGKPCATLTGAEVLDGVNVQNNWSLTGYVSTPWESYTYDSNDLGYKTHPALTAISTHWHTPANSTVDALGRAVRTITRLDNNIADNKVTMRYEFDIQGNLLSTTDALNRIVFRHKYGIAKQLLFKEHLDSGISKAVADVAGKPIEATDARDAQVLNGYDAISRPKNLRAKDAGAENITLRQVSIYAESLGLSAAANLNLLGLVYQAYDEAGLNQIESCDFKSNPLEKFKQVINDDELLDAAPNVYTVDWTGLDTSILDTTQYRTAIEYDALNRGIRLTLPADVNTDRAIIAPVFNKAGALQGIKKDGNEYVKYIAYDAKGQQLLAAWDNDIMMRFAYDKKTFRLKRVKAEKYEIDSGNDCQYNPLSGNSRYDQLYTYDLTGNILQVNDATPDCGISGSTDTLERLFEYDALYRLIYANGREMNTQGQGYLFADAPEIGNPTASNCRYYEQEYEYDKAGNIQKQKHRVIGHTSLYYTRKFEYNPANNQHIEVNNNQSSPTVYGTFTYDACGNMLTTNTDRNYAWNYANQLKSYKLMSGSTVNTFAHYLYSGGSRTKKLVIKDNGDYESITYIDGVFEYHKKVTTGTTEEKNYLLLQGNVEIRIGGYTGEDGETTLYTISDYLSSAAIRLKDDGALYDKEEYYPYGDSSLKTYGKKRYRFTGKEKDEESGLYYYSARYYSSWCMKFLSVDPLAGKYAHQSGYCYADGNPVVKNDPTGLGTDGGPKAPEVNNIEVGKDKSLPLAPETDGNEVKLSDVKPDYNAKPKAHSKENKSKNPSGKVTDKAKASKEKTVQKQVKETKQTEKPKQNESKIEGDFTPPSIKGENTESTDYKNIIQPMKTKADIDANIKGTGRKTPLNDSQLSQLGINQPNNEQLILNSPVGDARISSAFLDTRTCAQCSNTHGGTDYAVPTGTDVHATANGVVARSYVSNSYGNIVIIDHGPSTDGNVYTVYAHGSERLVSQGDVITTDQTILRSGNTGNSTGPHLHYEVVVTNQSPYNSGFFGNLNIRFAPARLGDFVQH